MAFHSGFFDSKGLDRTYTAEDFTAYLSSIICNGILDTYGDNFNLTSTGEGRQVVVGTGKAWINGHYFVNDEPHLMDFAGWQDPTFPRYIAIVIACDTADSVRNVWLDVVLGQPAENPQLPEIPTSETRTNLLLYAVRMNPGASCITEADWWDYRADENVCGYCKCILGKCGVSMIQQQTAELMNEVQNMKTQVDEISNTNIYLLTMIEGIMGNATEMGRCGENVYYIIFPDGTLKLRGTGATYDYEIGESPFFENENITSLVVSEGITAIGKSIFERCSNMETASLPTTLESIGERAFFMYKTGGLTALNFPESIRKIGEKAFVNQAVDSVILPETLTELGTYIFMDSSTLQNVRVECAEIPDFCFTRCSKLSQMTISRNIREIGSYMTTYCNRLQEIVYEGSVTEWSAVRKMRGWDGHHTTGTSVLEKIICENGYFEYDSENNEWSEMSA